jgi:cobalt-zinc-cadmium efflux system protein
MSSHNHTHFHNQQHHIDTNKIKVAFWLNLIFASLEVFGGFWTNSLAILSDSFHDFGDACALGLAWYFQTLAQRKSDDKFTYGYGRFSLLSALINTNILTISSVYIIYKSFFRLFTPEPLEASGMLGLAVMGIIVNGIAAWYLNKGKSLNEKVMSLHLLEDVMGWVAILVGSIVIYFTNWFVIDAILSLAISLYILKNAITNMKAVLTIFLQQVPAKIDVNQLKTSIAAISQVQQLTDFHLWTLNEDQIIASIHLSVLPTTTYQEAEIIKDKVREVLESSEIHHITIEIDYEVV